MTLLTAALAAQVAAAVSAVMLARRRPSYVPGAVTLVLFAAATLSHAPVLAALRPLPRPVEGAGLALIYLDGAISLATSALVAGLAVAVAAPPARRRLASALVAGAWLLASVVLGALYPSPIVRGAGLQRIYFAFDLIALFVATVALIAKARANIAAKESPDAVFSLALMMAIFDAGILLAPLSPWRVNLFGDYFGPQLIIAVFFSVVTTVQVILWALSTRRT